MGTVTPIWGFYKPTVGETGWGTLVDANWDVVDANLTNSLPRSYLAGLQTFNDGSSPNTKIDINAGICQDTGNAGAMTLTSTLIKDISAPWAVGTGNGGLAAALTLAASTWYHLFIIKRTDTNVVDAFFDTSVTAANIPSPYTLFRRIASVLTDGSKNLIAYTQSGDLFEWSAPVSNVNGANPGTSAILQAMTVPLGINVIVYFSALINNQTTTNIATLFTDPAQGDTAPDTTSNFSFVTAGAAAAAFASGEFYIRSDTSKRIRYRLSASGAADTLRMATKGWVDTRGRDS